MYQNILLIECPGVKLKMNNINLGAVRTNHPKISQLTLAAIIEREFPQANVQIVDMKSANPNNETKFKEIGYGSEKIDVYRVGQDYSEIENLVKWSEAVILTNNFTQEAGVIGDLIESCKKVNPHIRVFVGGSDAGIKTDEVNRQSYFYSRGADYIAPVCDGEIILPSLLKGEPIGSQRILSNFDKVPDPALHLADLTRYIESHEGPLPIRVSTPLMYLETSRGCKNMCDFCSTPFTKGKYRFMSQKRIEELLQFYKGKGISTLLLSEDNILSRLDLPNGRKMLLKWFKYMRNQGFAWEFSNGIEIGKLTGNGNFDEELIEALFGYDDSTGCYRSYIPLERIDLHIYRKIKPFEIQKKILSLIVNQKVPLLNLGIIMGNPYETQGSLDTNEKRMNELMDMISEHSYGKTQTYANIFLHIPIPGTKDYKKFHKEGRLEYDINKDPELFNFYTSVVNGNHYSYHDLTKLRRDISFRLNGEKAIQIWEQTGRYHS